MLDEQPQHDPRGGRAARAAALEPAAPLPSGRRPRSL